MEQMKAAVPSSERARTSPGRVTRIIVQPLRMIIGTVTSRPTKERQNASTAGSWDEESCFANVRKTVKATPDRISQTAPSRLRALAATSLVFADETPLSIIMVCFSALETAEIDRIWRTLPIDHVWSGWAAVDEKPETIWLYRRRQNWRRFELLKEAEAYVLTDEAGAKIGSSAQLNDILCDLEIAPPLVAA